MLTGNSRLTGRSATVIFWLAATLPAVGNADSVTGLLDAYRNEGAETFSAARGEALWKRAVVDPASGQKRACTSCHTADLHRSGKHIRTGKTIEAMAPSTNPARLTDRKKIARWLKRNCKWTLGRLCSPQEKGDVLTYLSGQ